MPDVYLSPSTQDYNPYIIGGSEKYYMNLLADAMEPYLASSGISYGRNDPNGNAAAAVTRGNRGNYRLYLALHSNAAPEIYEGMLRGPDVYYYPTSAQGKRAAEIIANGLREIYPEPELVNTRSSTELLELRRSKAPAVYLELAYHDNEQDARWIADNIDAIAENLVISIADFLSVQYYPPVFPAEGTVRTRGGVLNVRRAPNTTSAVIGTLPNGRAVKIIGALNGWYAIEFKNTTGYVFAGNISRN
ncbi:MAG: SH3 domain-containing protein [Oscillospiraceae bacterium]|nr:SH3 domain-containing protein [Oscillospiraceae bacterium]MCI7487993.1 SH3 domain-containing protein [Oscillospiraceae bacterium]